MKKVYVLLFSTLVLSACAQNETANDAVSETSNTIETSVQSSESSSSKRTETSTQSTEASSSEQTSEESSSVEDEEDFPYAVDLDDFVGGKDPAGKTIHHQIFETNQDERRPAINVDTKALNNSGNEISIDLTEGEHMLYPVSIASAPTKEITVLGDGGEKRNVKVNTEVKVEKYEEYDDSLKIEGDTYYLFYNDEGTMSLAARNFDENPGEKDLDSKNMVEYVQEYPNSAEDTADEDTEETSEDNSENEEKAEEYYDSIKAAWEKQRDYIDSIDDPDIKQSVQTSHSAAIAEATSLQRENPDDVEIIKKSVKKVLEGE